MPELRLAKESCLAKLGGREAGGVMCRAAGAGAVRWTQAPGRAATLGTDPQSFRDFGRAAWCLQVRGKET